MEKKVTPKQRNKPRYFSAEDYSNLFYISLVLIFILQVTFRLLTYNVIILKALNAFSVLLLCLGIACACKGFFILNQKGRGMNADLAVQILERYIREHKWGKREEERDVTNALRYLLENGLVKTEVMNLNFNDNTPETTENITENETKGV